MNENDEQMIRETLTKSLKDTHRAGLLQGSRAMCSVILGKAKDEGKTADERLADIVKFCEVSLGKNN